MSRVKPTRRIPRYVEIAMLKLMDDPKLAYAAAIILPHAARRIAYVFDNALVDIMAAQTRRLMALDAEKHGQK